MRYRSIIISALLSLFSCILTGQSIQTVIQTGHYASVSAVCYSPDGKLALTGSSDKTVKLWRRSDGREIRTFQGNASGILKISINSQATQVLAVGTDGIVTIWDINTGEIIRQVTIESDRIRCASFHPDGTRIITGSYKSFIKVWDIKTGQEVMIVKAIPAEHEYAKGYAYPEARTVDWSRDGKYIIAGVADYTAILWDAVSGKEIRKFKKIKSTCTSCISEALITPDNKYIINTSDDTIKVFDRVSGAVVKTLYGQSGSPEGLSISPDGKYIGAIEYGVAEIWDLSDGRMLSKTGSYSERRVVSMAIGPDGKEFITGNEKRTADISSIADGKTVMVLKGYLNQVDERILNDPYMYWAAMVNEARLSPDGNYIAVGRTGNNAKLVDIKTGKVF